jgi:drug/metabolite transporter (DMT)-like permease
MLPAAGPGRARGPSPGLFLLLGSAGAAGHFTLIKALELERASALSPIGYTQLLSVTLPGFVVFGRAIGNRGSWAPVIERPIAHHL